MTNIEEMAVQTFSVVPEAYQQVFIENGADFPDELVSAIKQDPEQAAQLLENDKQLKSAVVQVFKSNKESILQAAQQAQNPSSMKEGGKILGVIKFQLGGKYSVKNGSFSAETKAPGDTLRTKVYPYSTVEMQTYPNGNVRYTKLTRSDTYHSWSPNSKPNFLQRLWFGTKTAPVEEMQNWEQIIRNHPEDPRNIRKQQYGGENAVMSAGMTNPFAPKLISATMKPQASMNIMADFADRQASKAVVNEINEANKMGALQQNSGRVFTQPKQTIETSGSLSPTVNTSKTQNSVSYLNNLNAVTDKLNKVGGIQNNI